MRNYDELDEERDLKNFKKKSDVTEFGDRLNKNDICNGILLLAGISSLFFCVIGRGCQEIKKHAEKAKVPTAPVVTNAIQNVR